MKSGFCNVKVNAPAGWRQKIGQLLVKLCQRVDRSRWYLAVDFDCSPTISADDQRTIIVIA